MADELALLIRSVTISYQPVSADRPGTVVCPPIQQYVMKLVVTDRIRMNHCPECGARRFVAKLLVYEVTGYDEGGEQEFRRQHVRAEFEYTCSECQTTLRTLPADRRDYYYEVAVLETERRAALRDQLRQLGRRFWGRLAARTTWLVLVLVTLVTGLVIAL